MLNQSILVGRITREPEVKETENGVKLTHLVLAVQRPYKNTAGQYETDYISCVLWRGVAESTTEYCRKGDLIGVRGRIQTRTIEYEDNKKDIVEVIAEKVTFLTPTNHKNRD